MAAAASIHPPFKAPKLAEGSLPHFQISLSLSLDSELQTNQVFCPLSRFPHRLDEEKREGGGESDGETLNYTIRTRHDGRPGRFLGRGKSTAQENALLRTIILYYSVGSFTGKENGDRGLLLLLLLALSNSEWKNLRLIFFSFFLSPPCRDDVIASLFLCLLVANATEREIELERELD